jgi:hypothetical protein
MEGLSAAHRKLGDTADADAEDKSIGKIRPIEDN